MRKKLQLYLLALLLAFNISIPVSANTVPDDLQNPSQSPVPSVESTEEAQVDLPLDETIVYAVENFVTVELGRFNISYDELNSLFFNLDDGGRLPWYAYIYRCTYEEESKKVLTFTPINLDPKIYDRAKYEQAVSELINECIFEGMKDWQKALAVHDRLILMAEYDNSLSKYESYDLLISGSSVCEGYAEAYKDIMNRLGIPCIIVRSQTMGDVGHAWNLLKLGEFWYHVDCTWDDPTPDGKGYVSHDYFLVTDREISSGDKPHYDWVTEIKCEDGRFSDAYWKGNRSQVILADSSTTYLRENSDWDLSILAFDNDSGKARELYYREAEYYDIGQGLYTYESFGLSYYDGRLWFSDLSELFSSKPDFTDIKTEFALDCESEKKVIYSSYVADGKIHLTFRDHEGNFTYEELKIESSEGHRHSYREQEWKASCTEEGKLLSVCSYCGFSVTVGDIPATGHSYEYDSTLEKATAYKEGLAKYSCSNCGDSYEELIPKRELLEFMSDLGIELPEGAMGKVLLAVGAVLIFVILKAVISVVCRKKK